MAGLSGAVLGAVVAHGDAETLSEKAFGGGFIRNPAMAVRWAGKTSFAIQSGRVLSLGGRISIERSMP